MRQLTKKELIQQYNEGILFDAAVYNPSAFDAYVIVHCDDETVFGYYQYMDNEKEFFKVKLYSAQEDHYFRTHQQYLKLSMFMRLSYIR